MRRPVLKPVRAAAEHGQLLSVDLEITNAALQVVRVQLGGLLVKAG
jgi:hypothetical protein